jgi:hypothetical protein
VSPKRGDRAAPPVVDDEFDLRFDNTDSAAGWEQLAKQAPGNLRRAYDTIRADPRSTVNSARQHRLLGSLGAGKVKDRPAERWQYEVTGGGRIWYLIDDDSRTVWIVYAATGHPKATD